MQQDMAGSLQEMSTASEQTGRTETQENGQGMDRRDQIRQGQLPQRPDSSDAANGATGRPTPPEGAPELKEGEERPTPPEGAPELEKGEERPTPPEEASEVSEDDGSDTEETAGRKNMISRIGGAVKEKVGQIGKWFKGLFGRGDKTKEEAEETEEEEEAQETDETEDSSDSAANGGRRGPMGGMGQRPGEDGSMQNGEQGQPPEGMPGGRPGEMGGDSAPTEYEAATVVTEDAEGTTYTSVTDSENAVLVDGETVTLSGITVEKTGDSDGENADFYGINAGILANNGADLTLTGTTVTTDGAHANGVFSYGEGTTVTIADSTITTTGNNSGGLMTTGGGTLYADNVEISTSGNSSAAIRTDRGGGTVVATNSTGSTSGVGSPAIYSTADISVSNSTLTADNSEAVVIEGGNSVTLTNTNLTGNDATLNGQSTKNTNVLIYQSMSGDAAEGNSDFTMIGGSLTSLTGSMFHVTNVTTTINLKNVELYYADDSDVLLDLSADSWGSNGKNGGYATVNLSNQTAQGLISVDEVSGLTLKIADESAYTGAINTTGSAGTVAVTLESGSTWTLTGDSYIDSFEGDMSGINFNGYTLYINGEEVQA